MTWSTNPNEVDTPEVFFTSTAGGVKYDSEEILYDLWVVFDRMVRLRNEELAGGATMLLASVNATNGYVDLQWMNNEEKPAGTWAYTLYLPALHAFEHADGSEYFDLQARVALCCLSEDLYDNFEHGHENGLRRAETPSPRALAAMKCTIPQEYFRIFLMTELDEEPEELIV